MRQVRARQLPLPPLLHSGQSTKELEKMNEIIEANPESEEVVYSDLIHGVAPDKGTEGLSAEQVFRALVIKQQNGFSYRDLEFHLNHNAAFQWFCRLPMYRSVNDSSLERDIKKLRPETLEAINRILVAHACGKGIEKGQKVRTDCTGVESLIHEPKDSWLLYDSVRVLTRLTKQAQNLLPTISITDHVCRAKRRNREIENTRGQDNKNKLYKDLLKVTRKTVGYAQRAVDILEARQLAELSLTCELRNYLELARKVIEQTRRRVIDGEKVPADQKVLSIFEPHTDLIVKGKRDPLYGHKVCLTTGKSGLLIDCQVLGGNPNDTTLAVDAIERVEQIYGQPPRQAAFDAGFRSTANLHKIKDLGVEDVVFNRGGGLEIEDMARSRWVYRQLTRFRAGIESTVSFLKRALGWTRCTWRSLCSFKSYVWSSAVSANLLTLARALAT